MGNKYYAVKIGRTPGLYTSWSACEKEVKGFKGAIYKSFKTKAEAERFIENDAQEGSKGKEHGSALDAKKDVLEALKKEALKQDADTVVAYVDGSYDHASFAYSYGAVIYYRGIWERKEKETDPQAAKLRNVAGEILGAKRAMAFAKEKKAKKLTIVHDYIGIRAWCLNEWQAKNDITKAYRVYYEQHQDDVVIDFVKVEAHTDDVDNNHADRLAKEALK